MDEIRATFFEECTELLEQLEGGLLRLEAGEQDADTVDAVFRAVHSIKGGAGAFHLTDLISFSHEFETALDGLRTGAVALEASVVATLLRASDRLGDLVAKAADGEVGDPSIPKDLADLAARAASGGSDEDDDFGLLDLPAMEEAFTVTRIDIDLDPGGPNAPPSGAAPTPSPMKPGGYWEICFEPLPDLFASGNEPLYLFRALHVMGRLTPRLIETDLPTLEELDPSQPRVRWIIDLVPSAPDLTETEIESVFEFAQDLCVFSIAHCEPEDPEPGAQGTALPANVAAGKPDPAEAQLSSVAPDAPSAPAALAPEPKPEAAAAGKQPDGAAPDGKAKGGLSTTIRVDLDRIDRLVNLVGELVICQAMLTQSVLKDGLGTNSDSASGLDDLQQLTRDIQDSVMAIRAQPVRSLFQRMTRIVREAAQMTGKDIRLETEGEATEIDKTVVERLSDPLTHMIRNSIDHGIEAPDRRVELGKDRVGVVRLSARQQSDRVVIEITDDGRGIDRERVLARAIERGLVPADRQLDPAEIDRLLFLPGFSTADGISSLSGRGVGMDVVQRAIRDLNGTITTQSEPGKGSTFSISLPLTLAILDGMIVRSAQQRMVIPLAAIIETQTLDSARIESISPTRSVVMLQDRFVPLLDLAEGMGFARPARAEGAPPDEDSALLFVQPDDFDAYALRVDAIEAQRQVVIKGLGESFGRVPCVSAATILGDGQVALIIDPGGLALAAESIRSPLPAEVQA
ncbi:chemotaxis protein CheA [Jannaschia formosa]|uniref:chemotaxis protein CheA n=1 Tax=Jannaschia formosa TaxID=2259592 RepID=UPI001ADDB108|nr:chemotaxis protein CheA [Jannaschia formosa]